MCPALPVQGLGSDRWSADLYETTSLTFRLAARLKDQASVLKLASSVWKADAALKKLLSEIYENTEPPQTPPSREAVQEAVRSMRKLSSKIEEVYQAARHAGLTNRAFLGIALNSIHTHGEELLDIVEAVELALDEEAMKRADAAFSKSLDELHRNEAFDLADIK